MVAAGVVHQALGGDDDADPLGHRPGHHDDAFDPAARSRTSSLIRTCWAAFAEVPLTRTCPERQAAAAERVLNSRTAQVQLSTRTLAASSISR